MTMVFSEIRRVDFKGANVLKSKSLGTVIRPGLDCWFWQFLAKCSLSVMSPPDSPTAHSENRNENICNESLIY